MPSFSIRLPCAWLGKITCRHTGHDHGIDQPGEDREGEEQDDCGAEFFQHGRSPLGKMQGSDQKVDGLDADKGNDDPAKPVDQQIAAKQRTSADRTVGDALQR